MKISYVTASKESFKDRFNLNLFFGDTVKVVSFESMEELITKLEDMRTDMMVQRSLGKTRKDKSD